MSNKIFALKLQSPQSTAPPKDYILLLNEHFTPDEFVADLQQLYPAIPTTNGMPEIVVEGSYRMTPVQFLRYMMTMVTYTPEVEGGVCVPKLLGGGNNVKIEYVEGIATVARQPPNHAAFLVPDHHPFNLLYQSLWRKVAMAHQFIYTADVAVPFYAVENTSRSALPISYYQRQCKLLNLEGCFGGMGGYLPCSDDLSTLLIRAVYEELERHIRHDYADGKRGVLILGQPGIGKSVSLSYLLVQNLLHGYPTVLQTDKQGLYVFSDWGVEFINDTTVFSSSYISTAQDKTILALMDTTPSVYLVRNTRWFFIHASSPNEQQYRFWSKQLNPEVYYMAPWNWDEVVASRRFCMAGGLERDLVHFHMIYSLFGPIPRIIFKTLRPPLKSSSNEHIRFYGRWDVYEDMLRKKVNKAVKNRDLHFIEDQEPGVDSNTLMLIIPTATSPHQSTRPASTGISVFHTVRPITPHVIDLLVAATVAEDAKKGKLFFQHLIQKYPAFGSVEGTIFESLTRRVFEQGPALTLYSLALPHPLLQGHVHAHDVIISLEPLPTAPGESAFRDLHTLRDALREAPGSHRIKEQAKNIYLRPQIGNLAAVDAIALITADHIAWRHRPLSFNAAYPTLVLFQATVSFDHPISSVGLNDLLQAIPIDGRRNPIIFLWVVPQNRIQQRYEAKATTLYPQQRVKDPPHGRQNPPLPNLYQMILTVSNNRLWSLAAWKSLKEDALDLQSVDLGLNEFESQGHIGDVVRKGQRILSSHINTMT